MPTIFKQETVTVWRFSPQPDITAYELARALIYLDSSAWHQMPMTTEIVRFPESVDFPDEIARHFQQVDERQVEVPYIQSTRLWEEGTREIIAAEMASMIKGDLEQLVADMEDLDAPL